MVKTAKRRTGSEHAQSVLSALQASERPISAYEIMARVANGRDFSPATIYRALDRLIRDGRAHKIESLNAFVACQHPEQHETPAFAICQCCGTVTEFFPSEVGTNLVKWSRSSAFEITTTTLELRGVCQSCQPVGAT
jgi:Fur family transcriptional regulator, zinc uptake regulator